VGKSFSEALPLEARGIVVEAVGRRLLDGVTLELCTGPRSVTIGSNGAGKSLLLRVLHGLTQPTASLDPASIPAIEGMINEAHAAGTKIVLVTQDLGQARRMADEVIFLHRGRIEARAPAPDFFSRPGCAWAETFLAGGIVD
jgi:tungstate transport system ATP-binding protein